MENEQAQLSDVPAPLPDDPQVLRRVISAMPVPVILLDRQWRIAGGSRAWIDTFDVEAENARRVAEADATHVTSRANSTDEAEDSQDRPSFFELYDDADGEWRHTFETCIDKPTAQQGGPRPLSRTQGALYWVEWAVRPWCSEDGTPQGLLLGLTDRTREHQTEALSRRVQERFDALTETITEGVLLMDANGRFRDCNQAAQDILGRSEEEIVGSTFHDDRWSGLREDGSPLPNVEFPVWRAYVQREAIEEEVMGIYPPDAPPRWIRVNAQPLFHGDEPDPYAVLACFEDVTETRLKEEALQTSRDLLSSVLASSLDGILVFGTLGDADQAIEETKCLLANPQAEKVLNTPTDDLLGDPLAEVLPDAEEVDLIEACRTVVETGDAFEGEVCLQTERLDAWMHVVIVEIDGGVAVTLRNVSERKEAQQRILEQAQLLDRAHDAILAYDMDRELVYWNKGAERLTGWSKDDALGTRTYTWLYDHEEEKLERCHATMMKEGEWSGELCMRTRDGDERIVKSRWSLVHDASGSAARALVINTDVTERKRLESQFLRSQRMESIGRLVGGIAHDLGNLLMPITLGVKVLRGRLDTEDEKVERTLSMIEDSASRGTDMVEQVLGFARGVEGERIALHLKDIIDEVGGIVDETFPDAISFETPVPSDLPSVLGDPTQVQQVLMNLCVNARDAMPDGGVLTISADVVSLSPSDAQRNIDAEPGEYVCLQVQDTGSGIPDDAVDKIFEPFFSTKEESDGTGLGLSTAYSIVTSHDGFLEVESEEGTGSTFSVFLPIADEQKQGEESPSLPASHRDMTREGQRVLVVDDEEYVREATEQVLTEAGYHVATMADAQDAVQWIEEEHEVDVVITDLQMPGMSGLELIDRLRSTQPNLPIVAISGLAEGRSEEALRAGAQSFLAKPLTADDLQAALRDVLNPRDP